MSTSIATAADPAVIAGPTLHRNLSTAALVEAAIRRGEGELAANGAIVCDTGARRGRSPSDKFLEATPAIHASINSGTTWRPIEVRMSAMRIVDHRVGCLRARIRVSTATTPPSRPSAVAARSRTSSSSSSSSGRRRFTIRVAPAAPRRSAARAR